MGETRDPDGRRGSGEEAGTGGSEEVSGKVRDSDAFRVR